ncbi:cof family hydrolase [Mycobacterium tuberculosis]|nr:cof family hydrolase [Mycobacterium tuberculosis]
MNAQSTAALSGRDVSMIISDLDGTLLDDNAEISHRTADAIANLNRLGIHFIIATARPLRDIVQIAKSLSLDGPIICQNGAVIAYRPEPGSGLLSWLMDTALQRRLVDYARAEFPGCSIAIDYPRYRLADPEWPGPYGHGPVHHSLWPLVGPELPTQRAACLLISGGHATPGELERAFRVTVTTSSAGLLEVSRRGIDKAKAMLHVCKMLNVSLNSVISFGDMPNDLSMLARSGLGVAVANAPESVRATADMVARSNTDDGVAEMIEFILRRRS